MPIERSAQGCAECEVASWNGVGDGVFHGSTFWCRALVDASGMSATGRIVAARIVRVNGYGARLVAALEADECWVWGRGDAVDVAVAKGAAAVVALGWVLGEVV